MHGLKTTIDIDASVLSELKRRQRREHKPLGRLVSELLARALADEATVLPPELQWVSQPMIDRMDLEDKDALAELLDGPSPPRSTRTSSSTPLMRTVPFRNRLDNC